MDVGGNDLFVARGLVDVVKHTAVIDPICAENDGKTIDGIKVFGRFVEDVNLSRDLPRISWFAAIRLSTLLIHVK